MFKYKKLNSKFNKIGYIIAVVQSNKKEVSWLQMCRLYKGVYC